MKVVHLTWVLSVRGGGLPPAILRLASAQRALGASAEVIGLSDGLPALSPDVPWVHTVEPLWPLKLGWSGEVKPLLDRLDPDVLHLHGLFTMLSSDASRWARRTGRPLVISTHGMLSREALAISPLRKRVFRALVLDRAFRRAACFHALGRHEVADIRVQGVTAPVAVAPNGIEVAEVDHPEGPAPAEARVLTGKHPVLLFLGRVHPIKGLASLVEAWSRARRDEPRCSAWELAIVGPDQLGHTAELRALAGALGVADSIRFLGPAQGAQKRGLLRDATAFVLPSRSEGSSIAVLEAMAARLPVVLTRTCNMDEVATSRAGWVVEPEPAALARALGDLARSAPAELAAMGGRARRCVETSYLWPRIARDHLDVYRWLRGEQERPACVDLPAGGGAAAEAPAWPAPTAARRPPVLGIEGPERVGRRP